MKRHSSSDEEISNVINNTKFNTFDATLHCPFMMCIVGQNQTGKSTFVINLLKNQHLLIDKKFDSIVYFYGIKTESMRTLKKMGVICVMGLPENADFSMFTGNSDTHKLFIFDDLLEQISSDERMAKFVMNDLHHRSTSVIFVMQDLFYKGKTRLTLTRQAHYFVLMKNILDKQPLSFFARKYSPEHPKKTLSLFNKILKNETFSYIFIDGSIKTPDKARLRYDIFNDTPVMKTIYLKNNDTT